MRLHMDVDATTWGEYEHMIALYWQAWKCRYRNVYRLRTSKLWDANISMSYCFVFVCSNVLHYAVEFKTCLRNKCVGLHSYAKPAPVEAVTSWAYTYFSPHRHALLYRPLDVYILFIKQGACFANEWRAQETVETFRTSHEGMCE